MLYSVMQTDLEAPPCETLVKAFKVLPQLVDIDAANLARTAYGILVRHLNAADAQALCHALNNLDVKVVMVDERQLIPLPSAKRYRRIDVLTEGLRLHELMGPGSILGWERVRLAAAGKVMAHARKRIETKRLERRRGYGRHQMVKYELVTDVSHRDLREAALWMDLLIDVEPGRIQIDGNQFLYNCLGDRILPRQSDNFELLIGNVFQFANRAVHNRGLDHFGQSGPPLMSYPSKHTYEEEIVWLLWRKHRAS